MIFGEFNKYRITFATGIFGPACDFANPQGKEFIQSRFGELNVVK